MGHLYHGELLNNQRVHSFYPSVINMEKPPRISIVSRGFLHMSIVRTYRGEELQTGLTGSSLGDQADQLKICTVLYFSPLL